MVRLPCIMCHETGSVDGVNPCELCEGEGFININETPQVVYGEAVLEERMDKDRWKLDDPIKEDEGDMEKEAMTVDDLADLVVGQSMVDKPYNATLTSSLTAYLDLLDAAVVAGAGWKEGVLLPPGVVEMDDSRSRPFRRIYGFDFVVQAQKWARTPEDVVLGTRYKNMLVSGSQTLPDGNFYVQYLYMGDEEEVLTFMSLRAGLYRVRHFVANIYDYSSERWPDGWYRVSRQAGAKSLDFITKVRGGRIDNGQGAALLWMENPPDNIPYKVERVHVLGQEEAGAVRDAVRSCLAQPIDAHDYELFWTGELEWKNAQGLLADALETLST